MNAFAAFALSKGVAVNPPFSNHKDMYRVIDATVLGDAPWSLFSASYTGPVPTENPPPWMKAEYDVWFRNPKTVLQNMLTNSDFKDEFNVAPYEETRNGVRQYTNLMSGNWAWRQAVCIIYHQECSIMLTVKPPEHHCKGPSKSRGDVLSFCAWQRQDYGFCCHRSEQVLSTLYLAW